MEKNCLKQFVSELCNQNKTDILISFDYGDLQLEVLNLLYKRAQSSDLRTSDFYRILYSIYVKVKDYRKAALCLYECYLRLKREILGLNSLKRQEKCLLACLNLLKLVDKKFAWISILQPRLEDQVSAKSMASIQDLKLQHINSQTNNSNADEAISDLNYEIKIIDLDEINRNYLIVYYTLKLSTLLPNQSSLSIF